MYNLYFPVNEKKNIYMSIICITILLFCFSSEIRKKLFFYRNKGNLIFMVHNIYTVDTGYDAFEGSEQKPCIKRDRVVLIYTSNREKEI